MPIPVGDQVDYLAVNSRKGGGARAGGAERVFILIGLQKGKPYHLINKITRGGVSTLSSSLYTGRR